MQEAESDAVLKYSELSAPPQMRGNPSVII